MRKKKKRTAKNVSLIGEILPKPFGKAYQQFKKQQEINKLKKIKLEEREETKRLLQDKKDLIAREEKIKKEEERLKAFENELNQKSKKRNNNFNENKN